MTFRRSLSLSLSILATTCLLASCSSSQQPVKTGTTSSSLSSVKKGGTKNVAKANVPKPVPAPAVLKQGKKLQIIVMKNSTFSPSTVTVKAGTVVQWLNKDSIPHTVTGDTANGLASLRIAKGHTYTHVFADIGTFTYHCSIHPTMKGKVIVK